MTNQYSTGHIDDASGQNPDLQVLSPTSDGSNDAFMAFHKPLVYATYFGLDRDNEFAFGGWSEGAARYKFLTEKTGYKKINARRKVFDIRDYGAVSDGPDCAPAIMAALGAINNTPYGGELFIPGGTWICNNEVAITMNQPVRVFGQGRESRLHFTGGMSRGFVLAMNGDVQVVAEGFQVSGDNCPNIGTGEAALVRFQGGGGKLGALIVRDLYLEGSPSCRPGKYLHVQNTRTSHVDNVVIQGGQQTAYGTTGVGIYVDGFAYATTDLTITNSKILGVGTGIEAVGSPGGQPTFEGLEVSGTSLIGVGIGLYMHGGYYKFPGYAWRGGHINAAQYCFKLFNMAQFKISDGEFYLTSGLGPQAHVLCNGTDDVNVHNNTFYYIDGINSGDRTPITAVGVQNGASCTKVIGNQFDLGMAPTSYAVWAQADAGPGHYAGMNVKRGGGPFGPGFTDWGNNIVV